METSTLCFTPTHTSIRCCLNSFTSCVFFWKSRGPDFVINWIEAMAVRWPKIWKFIQVSYSIALSDWRLNNAQNVRVDTARGKDNDQQNLSKMIM